MQRDAITWFEIPVTNLDRAQRYYEALIGQPLRRESMGPSTMAVFPSAEGGATGCLHAGATAAQPQRQGTLVYLDVNPALDAALQRAVELGGQVSTPRTALPPGMGYFAHIVDVEGNRVGLHALN